MRSITQFTRWCVKIGVLASCPLDELTTLRIETDRRIERRALTTDELEFLLKSTAEGVRSDTEDEGTESPVGA